MIVAFDIGSEICPRNVEFNMPDRQRAEERSQDHAILGKAIGHFEEKQERQKIQKTNQDPGIFVNAVTRNPYDVQSSSLFEHISFENQVYDQNDEHDRHDEKHGNNSAILQR